ncbi:GNAT family N-acetyltransferase [Catellatospora tritici]|uniref:GNAT family N-acetyltransferase n=1 Tax=Catellatospora tritici TaxID=2851566 RepID=UPI001C2DC2E3|nr:GNAT family N-acetyltransferase [Catellatospora tritici]MBV1851703.1 GNAT family N-acetyltransferase [Catellatospora tritici]
MLTALNPTDLVPGTPLAADLHALYAGNAAYHRLSGEFGPDLTEAQVLASVTEDLAVAGAQVFAVRDDRGAFVGIVNVLAAHPKDGLPWIGLVMVDAGRQGTGLGTAAAREVHELLRGRGCAAVRLAVLENNPAAFGFWTSLGYTEVDRRPDLQFGRPCIVMHRPL